jgi:uncharacterized protein (AIM24 family)
MRYDISGTVKQTVSLNLDRGATVFSQTHGMTCMTDGITMDTNTGGGATSADAAVAGGIFGTILGNEEFIQFPADSRR